MNDCKTEQTLAIVKPDAYEAGHTGDIIAHLEAERFRIVAARVVRLDTRSAERFYGVHVEKPFFRALVDFMTSGPCVPLGLRRENAVAHLRKVIGATDPAEAEAGTVRALYAESKQRNAIHASDSRQNARMELAFFFSQLELGA
ncbi:MAG: nucleoside-diphosphate kinase [Gemmatimonadota bacterium]